MTGTSISKEPHDDTSARVRSADDDPGSEGHRLRRGREVLLAELDEAKFSLFHVKIAFVSGVGFFTDAYDIFAISIVIVILGYLYGRVPGDCVACVAGQPSLNTLSALSNASCNPGPVLLQLTSNPVSGACVSSPMSGSDQCPSDRALWAIPVAELTSGQTLGITIATPAGVILGQLLFGWLGDKIGRKRSYGTELIIIMLSTILQALSGQGTAGSLSTVGVLVFWRFTMGVGIGGDYPISAVLSSEFSSVRASLVALAVVSAYKSSLMSSSTETVVRSLDQMWRVIVGLGCVPGALALYSRLTIPESPRFTMDIERNLHRAVRDIDLFMPDINAYVVDPDAYAQRVETRAGAAGSTSDFVAHFRRWRNLKVLVGTAYSWFALDIAFYGLGLNSGVILKNIKFPDEKASTGTCPAQLIYGTLHNIAAGNLVLSAAGLVPGYWAAFLLIDRWGRKPLQFIGFSVLTVLFIIITVEYESFVSSGGRAFVALYCLANFFQNFGPNTTTFIVPGEAFPTRYRATAHGISAAAGKLGAVLAQLVFQQSRPDKLSHALLKRGGGSWAVLTAFMFTGILSTALIPETKQKSLEALSEESREVALGRVESHGPSPPRSEEDVLLGAQRDTSVLRLRPPQPSYPSPRPYPAMKLSGDVRSPLHPL
ncbi:major facilitator superfamily domain-containing protein [Trametes elegans]|nr:major facilitator superfamily domain-containing protein [Trametes elegans]